MRAATVIMSILIFSSAAYAQEIGAPRRGPAGGGFGGIAPQISPEITSPGNIEVAPEAAQPAEAPAVGGDGPPPEEAHVGHGHAPCHDEWVCATDRYEATDNLPVGSTVSGITSFGRWIPGPCHKQKFC